MSEQANPRRTGLFVVGAVVLLTAAVLALGSGQLFRQQDLFVAYFEGSVKGLQVGAPVTFRGVRIGEVREVYAVFADENPDGVDLALDIRIEVVFALDTSAIHDPNDLTRPFRGWSTARVADWAIEQGFVATLATQSLLTGLKYVDLEIRPDGEHRLSGLDSRYPELPTRQTEFARIQERLSVLVNEISQLPAEEIGEEILATLRATRALMESPEIPAAVASVDSTMDEFGTMARNVDEQLTVLISRLDEAADATREAMVATGNTMERVGESTGERSRLQYEIYRTLDDLTDAVEALRLLAEFLERHPESILSGRGEGQ